MISFMFVICCISIAETLHLKSEVGRSPFPSRDIYINQYDIPRRSNLFCKHHANISKTVSRFFLFFFCFFPVFRVYSNRIYGHRVSYVMIMSVHDWSLSAWREYLAFRCIT